LISYLTLELTKNYPVIAFESNIDRTTTAKERLKIVDDLQTLQLQQASSLEKRLNAVDLSRIVHVSEFLTPENAEKIFEESTKEMFAGNCLERKDDQRKISYLLTGKSLFVCFIFLHH
jgi:hypothetical protein